MKNTEKMKSKIKEFEETNRSIVDDSGFFDSVNSLWDKCSELNSKGFHVEVLIKNGEILKMSCSKRGPDWKVHKLV